MITFAVEPDNCMEIRFCPHWSFDEYNSVNANTIDEMRGLLKEEFERVDNKEFSYLWFDNGYCATYFTEDDQETEYEHDTDKMLDMVAKRMEDFGICHFHYDGGLIAIYTDEAKASLCSGTYGSPKN